MAGCRHKKADNQWSIGRGTKGSTGVLRKTDILLMKPSISPIMLIGQEHKE